VADNVTHFSPFPFLSLPPVSGFPFLTAAHNVPKPHCSVCWPPSLVLQFTGREVRKVDACHQWPSETTHQLGECGKRGSSHSTKSVADCPSAGQR